MRKASKILLILGGVFALLAIYSLVSVAISLSISGLSSGLSMILSWFAASSSGEEAGFLLGMGIGFGIGFNILAFVILCTAVFPLISAILAFIGGAKKSSKKGIYIVNIVFAVILALNFDSGYGLISAVLILVGSFLALSAIKEETKTEEERIVEEVLEEVK